VADLYLDNDVSLHLAPLLRAVGHQVMTARDLGLGTATDDVQLLTAARQRWTLVTSNRRDFRLLHDAWRTWPAAFNVTLPPHAGILVLDHAAPEEQFQGVEALLAATETSLLEGELFWWRPAAGWRRLVGTSWEPYPDEEILQQDGCQPG
jgi:predicted nuclease of predicted toxin-antitoxin system